MHTAQLPHLKESWRGQATESGIALVWLLGIVGFTSCAGVAWGHKGVMPPMLIREYC